MKKLLAILLPLGIILALAAFFMLPSGTAAQFSTLSPQVFSQELSKGDYQLIDVRTKDEYLAGHLNAAVQSDYYQTDKFSQFLESLDKKKQYLVYCRSGHRSGQALKIMQSKGFTHVSDMAGGYNAWIANNLPTER